jgi:hypothetical protein
MKDGRFIRGGTRNASTRVADKVGRPINWWPTLVHDVEFSLGMSPRRTKKSKICPELTFTLTPHLLRSSKLTHASFSSTRMSGLPKSKRAKPAKAEPAMPEATKAELTKAELTKADLANADLVNADLTSPPEAISTTPDKIEFSPAIPWPAPFDVQKRIQELRGCLDPKNPWYEFEQQHVNIKAVIKLYEDGILDGSGEVFIMQGKIVTEEEMLEANTWAWIEVYSFKCLPRIYLTNGLNYREWVMSLLKSMLTVMGLLISITK